MTKQLPAKRKANSDEVLISVLNLLSLSADVEKLREIINNYTHGGAEGGKQEFDFVNHVADELLAKISIDWRDALTRQDATTRVPSDLLKAAAAVSDFVDAIVGEKIEDKSKYEEVSQEVGEIGEWARKIVEVALRHGDAPKTCVAKLELAAEKLESVLCMIDPELAEKAIRISASAFEELSKTVQCGTTPKLLEEIDGKIAALDYLTKDVLEGNIDGDLSAEVMPHIESAVRLCQEAVVDLAPAMPKGRIKQ